jgi:hypothetical protein
MGHTTCDSSALREAIGSLQSGLLTVTDSRLAARTLELLGDARAAMISIEIDGVLYLEPSYQLLELVADVRRAS